MTIEITAIQKQLRLRSAKKIVVKFCDYIRVGLVTVCSVTACPLFFKHRKTTSSWTTITHCFYTSRIRHSWNSISYDKKWPQK